MTSAKVPVNPVMRPSSVNHPPADWYEDHDWPQNDEAEGKDEARGREPRERCWRVCGRGARAARRGARDGRRPAWKVSLSGPVRVAISFMVGR